VQYDGIDLCLDKLSNFASTTNSYAYNPFIRAQVFEKPTGIRLLKKE